MPTTSLVPPGRLASILIERRTTMGVGVADLSRQSPRFSADLLDQIERGIWDLSDAEVDDLLDLYGIDLADATYGRHELIVDLAGGEIAVGETSLRFEDSTADVVLERYVSLLYLLRNEPVGRKLALRDGDLDTLGQTLDRRRDPLVEDLQAIMADRRSIGRTRRLAGRRRVLQAGLLLGSTIVGSLVMVGDVIATGSDSTANEAPVAAGAPARLVNFDITQALPGWTVHHGSDSLTHAGITNSVTRSIHVHVDPTWSPHTAQGVLMHEVGHAIDLEYLDDSDRRQWMAMRGIDHGWWAPEAAEDFAVGAGDFAEAVAAVTAGKASASRHGAFSAEQLDFVRSILDRAQARSPQPTAVSR